MGSGQVAQETIEKEEDHKSPAEECLTSGKAAVSGTDIGDSTPREQAQQQRRENQQPWVCRPGSGEIQMQEGQAHPGDAAAGTVQAGEEVEGTGEPQLRKAAPEDVELPQEEEESGPSQHLEQTPLHQKVLYRFSSFWARARVMIDRPKMLSSRKMMHRLLEGTPSRMRASSRASPSL